MRCICSSSRGPHTLYHNGVPRMTLQQSLSTQSFTDLTEIPFHPVLYSNPFPPSPLQTLQRSLSTQSFTDFIAIPFHPVLSFFLCRSCANKVHCHFTSSSVYFVFSFLSPCPVESSLLIQDANKVHCLFTSSSVYFVFSFLLPCPIESSLLIQEASQKDITSQTN